MAFPFPDFPTFSKNQLKFIVDFILIFNWCAWDIRKEVKSDPSMLDPTHPNRIVNKIVTLTITCMNRLCRSRDKPMKFPVVKDLPQPLFYAPKRDFQFDPRPFPPSSFPANNRPKASQGLSSSSLGLLMGHDPPDPPIYSSDDDEPGLCDDWDHNIPGVSLTPPFPPASLSPE